MQSFCLISAGHVEEGATVSLDDTLVEQTINETLYESEVSHEKDH